MTPPIAIIGAGPCGLTFARLLERNNVDYTVYERDSASAPAQHRKAGVGGSLDLHTNSGLRALQCAGLFDEFRKHARYDATGFALLNSDGELKIRVGEGREAPEIDRNQLRLMLLDSVPEERIRWDHGLKAVEKNSDGGWALKFTNGTKAEGFKLIVGADGAWSKVRPALTAAKPVWSGAYFIEGRVNHNSPSYAAATELAGKGNSASLGSGKALMVQQMADASYRVYMGVQASEGFLSRIETSDLTARLRHDFLNKSEFFADWSPKLKRFIADAEGPFRPWPLYSLPVEGASWPRVPGVTLLGDAAHLTNPNGEGVNLAMHDALCLAESIVQHCRDGDCSEEQLEKAIGAYEEDMFPRARHHIEDGNHMLSMFFAENAVEQWLHAFEVGSHEKDLQ